MPSFYQFLLTLWDAVFGWWEVGVFITVFLTAHWFVSGMVSQGGSREDFAGLLKADTIGGRYRDLLTGVLDRLDGWLTPRAVLDEVREVERPRWRMEVRRAWTVRLYDRCLLIAVVYPLLILLILWAVTGDEGRLGDLVVLEGGVPGWQRGLALGGLVLAIFFGRISATRERLAWRLVFLGLAGAVAFAGASAVGLAGALAVAGALSGAFASAVALAVAGAVSGGLAIALAVAVAVAFAGEGGLPSAGGLAGVIGLAGALAGKFAPELAVAVTFSLAVILSVETAVTRGWRPDLAYVGLTALLALELAGVVWWVGGLDERGLAPLLFIGVLPLVNAIFDFASIGLTRFALCRGLEHPGPRMWLWAAGDLVAAVLLFLGLKASAVLAVCALNAAAGGRAGGRGARPRRAVLRHPGQSA